MLYKCHITGHFGAVCKQNAAAKSKGKKDKVSVSSAVVSNPRSTTFLCASSQQVEDALAKSIVAARIEGCHPVNALVGTIVFVLMLLKG